MKYLLLLAFFICSFHSYSQEKLPNRPKSVLEIGIALGSYSGDLSPTFSKVNGGLNVGLLMRAQKRLNLRLDASYLYLQGQKLNDPNTLPPLEPPFPNNFFQSHTLNTSLSVQFNIVNSRHFRLYVAQGLGVFYYNPMDEDGNELIENLKDEPNGIFETRNQNEEYSNFAMSLPTRVGMTYYFENNFGFGLSATFVNPLTDYLDNVSELGNVNGNDQAMSINFSCFIPLSYGKLSSPRKEN
ncbi:outer membrane beta-barrel protein [Flammeovirga sp. SJP92]|uniref:outer membrane beta-barrel protein n=1 Tax=Flammeovirga sp. SJP92 TaxID=1775430 RepID=UPI0007892942|nr:outer membrane beta-barrel protein [Flammeovirga sp. SJP92]KXX67218.1 hypothetical protein AVL50_27925 [Flammeovirga sp. SJP92]